MAEIRLVLADDPAVVRTGLRMLLDAEEGLTVVAEAGEIGTARRMVAAQSPSGTRRTWTSTRFASAWWTTLLSASCTSRRISASAPSAQATVPQDQARPADSLPQDRRRLQPQAP